MADARQALLRRLPHHTLPTRPILRADDVARLAQRSGRLDPAPVHRVSHGHPQKAPTGLSVRRDVYKPPVGVRSCGSVVSGPWRSVDHAEIHQERYDHGRDYRPSRYHL